MTAALNETTSRLRAMETSHSNTTTSITNLSTRLDTNEASLKQQSNEIKTLSQAYETQNKLITALKTTQLQQGETIRNMDETQNVILGKLNILVQAAQTPSPPAEDRKTAGQHHE